MHAIEPSNPIDSVSLQVSIDSLWHFQSFYSFLVLPEFQERTEVQTSSLELGMPVSYSLHLETAVGLCVNQHLLQKGVSLMSAEIRTQGAIYYCVH